MCHCPGGVTFRAATPWRNRGMSDIPQSTVEELANFCDVSSSHELRTNPPVIDGSTKPWNAGGVATSPERDGAPTPCSLEGLVACQPRPKAHNYRACCQPDRASQPDRTGGFTADAPVPGTGGRPSPIYFSPWEDSCTRQAVTRAALFEKDCWLRHSRDTCEPTCLQNALQNWRFGTASPSRV